MGWRGCSRAEHQDAPPIPGEVKTQKEVVRIIDDARYRKHLLQALRTLRPAVEVMLWAYAYGKRIEHVEHTGGRRRRNSAR